MEIIFGSAQVASRKSEHGLALETKKKKKLPPATAAAAAAV